MRDSLPECVHSHAELQSSDCLNILFSGRSPFATVDHAVTATFDNIVKMALEFPESEWGGVSHAATELVAAMLCRNPQERPSATALLNHRWLRAALKLPDQVDTKFDATAAAAATMSTGMPLARGATGAKRSARSSQEHLIDFAASTLGANSALVYTLSRVHVASQVALLCGEMGMRTARAATTR
jgi:hypothetical protein